jgi:pimeloyl-ACP methyl ester carboxylesterase
MTGFSPSMPRLASLACTVIFVAACSSEPAATSTNPSPSALPSTTTTTATTTTPPSTTTSLPVTTTTTLPVGAPRFEETRCAAPVTLFLPHRCGDLVVPEDRANPDGRLVRLPVVIFEALADDPRPDPIIYLAGGGGADQLAMMEWYAETVMEAVRQRDFIMYNQRGSPRTEPELACPGIEDLYWELAGDPPSIEERNRRLAGFWAGCRDDLVAGGIDLQMYSTAVNAADADDLRAVLGYEQANYYATSYGTRIGLALIRDHPDGVRSIILDSAYPPEAGYYREYAANVDRTFTNLFAGCAADSGCTEAFGDLQTSFFETIDRLDAAPEVLTYPEGRVVIDGMAYVDAMWAVVQSTSGRAAAPDFIAAANEGDVSRLEGVFPALFDYPGHPAVYFSFQCQEEVPKYTLDEVATAAGDLPVRIRDFGVDWFAALDYAVCDIWGVEPNPPEEREPVASDVPALVLGGEFDPITPPAWGRAAAEELENGWFFEFPGEAHGVMRTSACAREIGLAFIDDPTTRPETGCLGD